jgi:hypothetical protein
MEIHKNKINNLKQEAATQIHDGEFGLLNLISLYECCSNIWNALVDDISAPK